MKNSIYICAGVVALALASCALTEPTTATEPSFTGPWADLLTRAYSQSTADLQRDILADGEISAAEYARLRDDFVECVGRHGATVTLLPLGEFTVVAGDVGDDELQNQVIPNCEAETVGYVGFVYEQISRNPERLDERDIVVECLVTKDVLEPSFSPTDLDLSSLDGLDLHNPSVVECLADPLDLVP